MMSSSTTKSHRCSFQSSGSSAEPMAKPLTEPLAMRIHRTLLPQALTNGVNGVNGVIIRVN